jgi:quercetin dioxygenase-like cupin family protein
LITANRTLSGQVVSYPDGIPEMRVYRITIPVGAKIPLHIHPSPVVVVVEQGRLNNVRIVDGVEVSETIESGEGFLAGHPAEPHYVINRGSRPAVSLVTFASVEGMPNQIELKP